MPLINADFSRLVLIRLSARISRISINQRFRNRSAIAHEKKIKIILRKKEKQKIRRVINYNNWSTIAHEKLLVYLPKFFQKKFWQVEKIIN